MEIEAARLLVYNAARMKECGMDFVKHAAMAKLKVGLSLSPMMRLVRCKTPPPARNIATLPAFLSLFPC